MKIQMLRLHLDDIYAHKCYNFIMRTSNATTSMKWQTVTQMLRVHFEDIPQMLQLHLEYISAPRYYNFLFEDINATTSLRRQKRDQKPNLIFEWMQVLKCYNLIKKTCDYSNATPIWWHTNKTRSSSVYKSNQMLELYFRIHKRNFGKNSLPS